MQLADRNSVNGFLLAFLVALRAEYYATLRMFSTWLLVVLPSIAIILRMSIVKLTQLSSQARGQLLGEANEPIGNTGFGFFVDGMSTGLVLAYLVFVGFAASRPGSKELL